MTPFTALTLYKLCTLLVGTAFAYMGYRLFVAGILGHAGELTAEWTDKKLLLQKSAPGTFFALFGTIIVAVTLFKGLDLSQTTVLTGATSGAPASESTDTQTSAPTFRGAPSSEGLEKLYPVLTPKGDTLLVPGAILQQIDIINAVGMETFDENDIPSIGGVQ